MEYSRKSVVIVYSYFNEDESRNIKKEVFGIFNSLYNAEKCIKDSGDNAFHYSYDVIEIFSDFNLLEE